MGTKERINAVFTDTSLPVVRDDLVIADSGSLILIDLQHSLAPTGQDLYNNLAIPNLVKDKARALIGGTESLDSVLTIATDPMHHSERTPKGGIHAIHGTAGDYTTYAAQKGTAIHYPVGVATYVAANYTHSFYISWWTELTRISRTTGQPNWTSQFGWSVSITGNHLWNRSKGDIVPPATLSEEGISNAVTGNPNRHRAATNGYRANNGAGGGIQAYVWTIGTIGTANSYLDAKTAAPSEVFYRYYMEDLTVSGRSYAEVNALDGLAFDRAFGANGRYNGDTIPTDPSAIP